MKGRPTSEAGEPLSRPGSDPLVRLMVRTAQAVKGDSAFEIDPELAFGDLLGFVLRRGMMAFRGVFVALRAHSWAFPVFVGHHVVITGARHLMLAPGVTIGDYCRLDCVGRKGVSLGRGVTLRRGTQIEVTSVMRQLGEGIVVGDRAGISEGCFIGAKGFVNIGANTMLGPKCQVLAENHVFTDPTVPIRTQGATRQGIVIGEDCWLGAGVVVLDGAAIGEGSVIGAGAVVTKAVEPYSISVGVPASRVGGR